jgi:hypothetical protein
VPQFIGFHVLDEAQYARAFDAAPEEMQHLREPLGQIRDSIEHSVAEQFRTEGAHSGARWTALNPQYEKWKQQHYPDTGILTRTGAAKNLLASPAATIDLTDRRLEWGIPEDARNQTGVLIRDYMEAHQAGRRVPQRKFIAITQAERRDWDRIIINYINGVRHRWFG